MLHFQSTKNGKFLILTQYKKFENLIQLTSPIVNRDVKDRVFIKQWNIRQIYIPIGPNGRFEFHS